LEQCSAGRQACGSAFSQANSLRHQLEQCSAGRQACGSAFSQANSLRHEETVPLGDLPVPPDSQRYTWTQAMRAV